MKQSHTVQLKRLKQLIALYLDLGANSPDHSADKFKSRNKIEYISVNDLKIYTRKLKKSATNFMTKMGNLR